MDRKKILLIGYGNPGRRDDGLGPAFAEAVEKDAGPEITVQADYQLNVEDAEAVARHEIVVFADADASGPAPFHLREIQAGPSRLGFTSHSLSPEDVLALARDLFRASPKAYVLGIRGYEFDEFGQRLSPGAKANLEAAISHWRDGNGIL